MANFVSAAWFFCLVAGVISSAYAQPPIALGAPPPPPIVTPTTSRIGTSPSDVPTAPISGSPSQMSVNEFEQWLKNNGYGLDSSSPPPSSASSDPKANPPASIPPPRVGSKAPITFEQGQQAMINAAPPAPFPISQDSAIAFNNLLQQNMPLAPEQIVQLRQSIDVSQRAAAVPANIPPKPVSSTIMINLAPGTTPPAIRLAQGYVTSLVFVDSTGTPWPVAAFDIGNPRSVNIQWDGRSNIILMQGIQPYMSGNMVIRLVGLPTPINLELVSGQRVVDYRVDLHVSGIGPNTKELPIGSALPNSANQLLLSVLDGIAPAGSKILNVMGAADSQAWQMGEIMFLRTRFTVLSPGWISTMVSPDGMHAYELPRTSTVLISRYGEPVELKIEGF